MKKALALLLSVVIAVTVLQAFGSVSVFAEDFNDDDLDTDPSGVYAILTNRGAKTASRSQELIDEIQAGEYFLSAQVRLREESERPVWCSLGINQTGGAWPGTAKRELSTEWTQISGTATLIKDSSTAEFYINTVYDNNSNNPAMNDIEVDSIFVVSCSDPNKVNLIKNHDFNELDSSWGKRFNNYTCVISFSAEYEHTAPSGMYAILTNRGNNTASRTQELSAGNPMNGDYFLSAQVRLRQIPTEAVLCSIGVLGDGKNWKGTEKYQLSTEWTQVSGIATLAADETATFFINTVDGSSKAVKVDIDVDSIFVVPLAGPNANVNLIKNPYFDDFEESWTAKFSNTACDISFSTDDVDTAPQGDYAIVTNRASRTASPIQNVIESVESGKYFISIQVRLPKGSSGPAAPVTCDVLVDQDGAWPGIKSSVPLTTDWQQISGIIELDKNRSQALFMIQTLYTKNPFTGEAWASSDNNDTKAAPINIEMDSACLVPVLNTSNNLLQNPGFDINEDYAIESWVTDFNTNLSCTLSSNNIFEFTPVTGIKDSTDGSISYANGQIPYSDENIVYSGRWFENNGAMNGSFEGYAEIRFTGTTLKVIGGGNTYVSVDGGEEQHFILSGINTVAKNLTNTLHTARIISQAQTGFPVIKGFIVDENCKTLPIPKTPTIEFIGDSITEGYIVGNNSYLNSYAYLTGKKLGWRFNTIAFGGIAATVGEGTDSVGIAERYLRQTEKGGFGENDYYAFANDDLDYTVINIGTNDGNPTSSTAVANFKSGYTQLLDNVFEHHPDCTVFVMIPFLGSCKTLIKDVVENYDQSKNIHIVYSDEWNTQFTYKTDSAGVHPDYESHVIASDNLYDIIMEHHNNRFCGVNAELGATLTVNFYAELENNDVSRVEVTRNGKTETLYGTLDNGNYKFAYTGINPQCMTDNIHVELFVNDELYQKLDYSVKEYCEELYESCGQELKDLIDATLAFGAAAQEYSGYNIEDLASKKGIPESDDIPKGIEKTVTAPRTSADNQIIAAGLIFENEPKIYFRVKVQDGVDIYLNGEMVEAEREGSSTYVYTDGIISTQFGTAFTLELKQGDEVIHGVQYSINTYLANKWDVSDNDKLYKLVHALNAYGCASLAYQATLSN